MYASGSPSPRGSKSNAGRNLAGCGCGLVLCLLILGGCFAILDTGDSATTSSSDSASPSTAAKQATPSETDAGTTPLPSKAITRPSRRTKRPVVARKPKPRPTKRQVCKPPAQEPVYYRNCAAARAAGKAPIHQDDPGYAPHLDRDGDGVGCE
ncbi:excalibur calcium-binding domain-containing protein [Actinomadura macra]|uniref:excalibur calcium-binding domain-containing protein n=1 Tax=Actinomadura macra TaxID=46164 RepID=UPI000A03369B|nr:excalibur calcium-binding domain-containing protein [Actinomadura macra]